MVLGESCMSNIIENTIVPIFHETSASNEWVGHCWNKNLLDKFRDVVLHQLVIMVMFPFKETIISIEMCSPSGSIGIHRDP